MQIHGFIKSTLLDYPKHLAATVFVGGCNMRCPFCHNSSMVHRPHTQPIISEDDIMSYLNTRKTSWREYVLPEANRPYIGFVPFY